ncbi:MAG: hypothetical protein PCFJNLEI_02162 [Verrucomicrobiae bacterium]|nr:hypothetical protein [Verrucomicrobiae bacterium]
MSFAAILIACAVCFGDPNSSQVKGQNAAIITLLGITAVVLTGFVAIIIRFARRARQMKSLSQVG